MSYLFIIEDKKVFPNPETLLISPFIDIWNRDKGKEKEQALKEFGYIEFMGSVKNTNPFVDYKSDVKEFKIREALDLDNDWQPDELVKKGIDYIVKLQTEYSLTYTYYVSAKIAAEKMKEFFTSFDINERNIKTGNPIYKPRDIISALNETEKTLVTLKSLEDKVNQEILTSSNRTKADKKISPFSKR